MCQDETAPPVGAQEGEMPESWLAIGQSARQVRLLTKTSVYTDQRLW